MGATGRGSRLLPDALRQAAKNDPDFAAALERARTAVTWEAEAAALRRLRTLAAGEGDVALEAAAAILRYGMQRRRDEARLAAARRKLDEIEAANQAHAQRLAERAVASESLWGMAGG